MFIADNINFIYIFPTSPYTFICDANILMNLSDYILQGLAFKLREQKCHNLLPNGFIVPSNRIELVEDIPWYYYFCYSRRNLAMRSVL